MLCVFWYFFIFGVHFDKSQTRTENKILLRHRFLDLNKDSKNHFEFFFGAILRNLISWHPCQKGVTLRHEILITRLIILYYTRGCPAIYCLTAIKTNQNNCPAPFSCPTVLHRYYLLSNSPSGTTVLHHQKKIVSPFAGQPANVPPVILFAFQLTILRHQTFTKKINYNCFDYELPTNYY